MTTAAERSSFDTAARTIEAMFGGDADRFSDGNCDADTRQWLNRAGVLKWQGDGITPDEWFFITTFYGPWEEPEQSKWVHRCFPWFVAECGRDIRRITPENTRDVSLGLPWMKTQLLQMAKVLKDRRMSMQEYVAWLRGKDTLASPQNPIPALEFFKRDHDKDLPGKEWKTLSVFFRDCVQGNCFPIHRRVANKSRQFGLPQDETRLVVLCLETGRNPRLLARLFYQAE